MFLKRIVLFVCALCVCAICVKADEKSIGDEEKIDYRDFIWLNFDFEDTLKPSNGVVKDDVLVEFKRPNEVYHPIAKQTFKANQPCFVKGFKGKGLFIGQHSENILSSELASMNYSENSKLNFIRAFEEAKYKIKKSEKEAFVGDSFLTVNADEMIRGGIALDVDVPGGKYRRGAYYIYVFSFYLKGKGIVQVVTDIKKGIHDTPKSIKLTDEWQRLAVWVASKKKTVATVNFRNMTGMKCEFCIDGLQLERKKDVEAVINKHRMQVPSGTEFTPGIWMPGGTKYVTDLFKVSWQKEYMFPVEEGTINLWLKPLFFHADAEKHQIVHPKNGYYEYLFGYNSLQFLREVRKEDEVNNSIEVARPKFLKKGHWGMLTLTWNNKKEMTKLYFNGRRLGFQKSDRISLDRDPELDEEDKVEQLKYEIKSMVIGSSGDRSYNDFGLMGVIDNLTIFKRALNRQQIQELYPFDVEDDD